MVLKYQHPTSNPDLADGWGSWAGGRSQAHRGLDYQPGAGAAIAAVASGTVSANIWNGALGNVLVIAHPDGMFSGYSHMRERSSLPEGSAVSRGQVVGFVGNTGSASNGAHLHLTITSTPDGTWNNGDITVTTDPYPFINARLNGDDPGTATPNRKKKLMQLIRQGQEGTSGYGSIAIVGPGHVKYFREMSVPNALTPIYGPLLNLTRDQYYTVIREVLEFKPDGIAVTQA
ncbi:M23 family metallopeptidase [Plantibacter sp. YIM 135347]|uniref:M23 family metallopeptidase n=1 Tax=Plantibacter sp. YIM 135347 TaxID=3423919 RepID=UPI003D350FF6